ncbi:MAG: tetratricopeptide repeat protein, partial [Planctomycetota bacterium]
GDLETAAVTLASLSGTDDGGVVTADAAVRQRAGYLLVAAEVTAGDWDGVRDAGGRFLEKYADAPEAAEVAYRVADAELRAGETRSAAARAERLLTDAPPAARSTEWFARVPLVVAEASRRDGDVETVLATLADVRKSNAHPAVRAEAEQIVGQALLKKARFEEARAAFRRALETPEIRLTATAARAEYGLAQTYFLKQQWRAASTSAFRAYSLYDLGEIRAPALLMVARCDEAVGERTKAIAAYNDVCSEFPDTEFAREASSRLAQLTE